jgi:hypothetical protein
MWSLDGEFGRGGLTGTKELLEWCKGTWRGTWRWGFKRRLEEKAGGNKPLQQHVQIEKGSSEA